MAFPVAPLLWIAIWIYMRNRKGGGGGGEIAFSRGFWLFVWIIIVWNSVFWLGFLSAGLAISENPAYGVPAIAAAIFCFPWTFARWVLIPRGWVRTTYFVLMIPGLTFWKDRQGGALAGAAWALLRSGRSDAGSGEWLRRKLEGLSPIRAGGLSALALLHAARNDREKAHRFMQLVLTFDRKARPGRILRMASEWLAAETAAKGAWHAVREMGSARGSRTRWTWFASLAARRILGEAGPHGALLGAAWLLAPARVGSLRLLRLATHAGKNTPGEAEPAEVPGSFAELLGCHATLWREEPVSLRDLDRTQVGWSRLFDGGTPEDLRIRAAAIAAANADHVWQQARAQVVADLTWVVKTNELPVEGLTPTGIAEEIRGQIEDEGMEELEQAAAALARRKAMQQGLPMRDELVEWCALRALYESVTVVSPESVRPLAFSSLYPAASNHAVWLFNGRGERPLGNAMLRYLLTEAQRVGDAEAIRLQTANVAIPIG